MKGVAWILPAALIIILLSVVAALFGFGTEKIIEKRALQEKILFTGNRIEITGNLVKQASDLATLQAVYDIGSFNIAMQSELEYNRAEKLPYWSRKEEDYIKQAILRLAEQYFSKYNQSFTDYFMNPHVSKERSEKWFVSWEKNVYFEKFDENEISINFGYFNITYDDSQTRISKKYPIVSHLKTKFNKTLEKSHDCIEMIKDGEDLDRIESFLSDNDVELKLEDRGNYVIVNIYEKSKRKVYDFVSGTSQHKNLGLKFLVDKKACYCITTYCMGFCSWGINLYKCPILSCERQKNLGVKVNELSGVKICKEFYILSNPTHTCDILN